MAADIVIRTAKPRWDRHASRAKPARNTQSTKQWLTPGRRSRKPVDRMDSPYIGDTPATVSYPGQVLRLEKCHQKSARGPGKSPAGRVHWCWRREPCAALVPECFAIPYMTSRRRVRWPPAPKLV